MVLSLIFYLLSGISIWASFVISKLYTRRNAKEWPYILCYVLIVVWGIFVVLSICLMITAS